MTETSPASTDDPILIIENILVDAIGKLEVIHKSNVYKTSELDVYPKIKIPLTNQVFDGLTGQPIEIRFRQNLFNKISKDIIEIQYTFQDTIRELKEFKTYQALEAYVQNRLDFFYSSQQFIEDYIHKGKLETKLRKAVRNEKLNDRLNKITIELKTEESTVFDEKLTMNIKKRYMDSFRDMDYAEFLDHHKQEIAKWISETAKYTKESEHIKSYSVLITEFLEMHTQQLADQAEDWSNRYSVDIEQITLDIDKAKYALEQAQYEEYELRLQYENRQQFIDDYRKEQIEKVKQKEFEIFIVYCACRLQAWWRGTMVRRGLGPYKKKKKGKKGKKGAGKQKKK